MLIPFNPQNNLSSVKNFNLTPFFRSLIYWPVALGYVFTHILKLWFLRQQTLKTLKKWQNTWKSELLVKVVSRNLNMTLYTPKIFSVVEKIHLMLFSAWKLWTKKNASTILYNITTGRCGFKPQETKSFIAGDTTIRAGLWLIYRNSKKLTPFKLHLAGIKKKITIYKKRIALIFSSIYSYNDKTPIPYNGCKLLHLPRKRFRRHEYNVQKVALFTKTYQYRT